MNSKDKLNLIKSIPVDFVQHKELEALINSSKPEIFCYDGFEPSGRMHIAQGLIRTINTNKLTKCGFKFKFWVADWFAMLNHKLGGDLNKIRKAGELMIETWKACGMDMDSVEFIWASEEINKQPEKYWSLVMDISSKFTVSRIQRCTQIMGRDDGDELATSQMFYPCMQCADIFFLGIDICSLGLDQRKVNMLALEYADKIKRKFKPIILSHAMIRGLDGSDKMSKSNPDSAIFMDDDKTEVKRKIKKAFCEPKNIEINPILDYYKHIVFQKESTITIYRSDENGSSISVNFDELENLFKDGTIHPVDLKLDLTNRINYYLEPIRIHFNTNKYAQKLLETVKKYTITR
jgi:tyrosyl-tRNA synthetase